MRSEKDMYELIIGFANDNPIIRAVGMEGSRVNPKVPKDDFQDYDISYFVTDMKPFVEDESWLDFLGERIIMQKPEAMSLFPPSLGGWFSYLMIFTDGVRVDLKIIPIEDSEKYTESEKGMIKILLDKDSLFPQLPPPIDKIYHIIKPSDQYYKDSCNEFWWVSTYVAKGLKRGEILYAIDHLNNYVRPELLRMLSWKIGIEQDFSVSVGKNNKYMEKYMPSDEWKLLLSTYTLDTYGNCWFSLFRQIDLFRKTAKWVSENLGYNYDEKMDKNVSEYLRKIHEM